MSINSATIMGRLVATPELRKTKSGISTTSFTVAVDRIYSKTAEERQTDFIEVVCWKQQAEFVSQYFAKGSMIAVTGTIQTRNFEDKAGNKRKAVEIVASHVSFCGDKKKGAEEYTVTVGTEKQADDFKDIPDFGQEDVPF